MYKTSIVRPTAAEEVFKLEVEKGDLSFRIEPVVLQVPEKAAHAQANLFVVISGWIKFSSGGVGQERPTTESYGTEVGYFREKDAQLEHVYGVHYDVDADTLGHPVFHAQVASQQALADAIRSEFRKDFPVGADLPGGLLRNVRVPTAQMDVFSVLTQVGADHMIWAGSPPEVRAAFAKLRATCDFLVGAGGRFEYLTGEKASVCYRSTHWYERD